jgi:hypothetical protein
MNPPRFAVSVAASAKATIPREEGSYRNSAAGEDEVAEIQELIPQ